jgi:SepF-like predicted cell division protein (DUF552 family)
LWPYFNITERKRELKGLSHEIEMGYVIILDRSVLEEEPLVVFKLFKCFFELKKNVNRNAALQRKGMEIATF